MSQITHDNHFIPQLYLKRWSKDGKKIWTYRTLVSNKGVSLWENRSIRGVACHRDLYTSIQNGKEIDEFERWLEAEFESPASEVIDKVINDQTLTSSDWEKLALFLAAQDSRTPTSYVESMDRWKTELPQILENSLRTAKTKIKELGNKVNEVQYEENPQQYFKNMFKVKITPSENPEDLIICAEVLAGRALWLRQQQFLLENTAKTLLNHKWCIVSPAQGMDWFTCDHPVVRLNYYSKGRYDFKGGWGNPGTDLMMPLTPKHLLLTEVGKDIPDRDFCSVEHTNLIQKIIAERALRWIYAKKPEKKIEKFRPREINFNIFKAEEEQLRIWTKEQNEAEITW
jgi:hypothetical protein